MMAAGTTAAIPTGADIEFPSARSARGFRFTVLDQPGWRNVERREKMKNEAPGSLTGYITDQTGLSPTISTTKHTKHTKHTENTENTENGPGGVVVRRRVRRVRYNSWMTSETIRSSRGRRGS